MPRSYRTRLLLILAWAILPSAILLGVGIAWNAVAELGNMTLQQDAGSPRLKIEDSLFLGSLVLGQLLLLIGGLSILIRFVSLLNRKKPDAALAGLVAGFACGAGFYLVGAKLGVEFFCSLPDPGSLCGLAGVAGTGPLLAGLAMAGVTLLLWRSDPRASPGEPPRHPRQEPGSREGTVSMTRSNTRPIKPSFLKVILWTLATVVGIGLGSPVSGVIVPVLSIVPCTVLQGLLIQRWCGLRWHRWVLWSSLWAVPGGLLTTVLMIPAIVSGGGDPLQAWLWIVALSGVYGAALGIGGVLALKPVMPNALGWIPISALAWGAGVFSMQAMYGALNEAFRLSSRWTGLGVTATQQLLLGLVAGFVSASLASLFLRWPSRGERAQGGRPTSPS